jgi:soluble lytic murein transglycosylase-like protein
MLRRLRLRRSFWAAVAAGILAVPAMLGGVAAAPSKSQDALPPPEPDPGEPLPPDPNDLQARLALMQAERIADLAPEEFSGLVLSAANRHKVDPRLVAAVVTVETRWNPNAVGYHGELGLMQILPSTGAFLARRAGLKQYNLADPATNLELGALYLSMLIQEYGTKERALAAYNGGPRAADSWRTNRYVRKVLQYYYQREAILAPDAPNPVEALAS